MELNPADFAFVSALLTATCVLPYLRDIYRGRTRPQRVSWFVFATLSIVAAVSQFLAGARAGAWLASGSAIGFTLVFVASIRHGVGGTSVRDLLSLAVALTGVVLSVVVERPIVAVAAVIMAEVAAISLTVRKAVRDPDSETASTWLIDALAGAVALLAVTDHSFMSTLYPVHHLLVNAWVLGAIVLGRIIESRAGSYRSRSSRAAACRSP